MRNFSEPTRKNLLRPSLVFGVPFSGLLALAVIVILAQVIGQGSVVGNGIALGIGVLGLASLRLLNRIGRTGWDESILFGVEWAFTRRCIRSGLELVGSAIQVMPHDTLDEIELIRIKEKLGDRLRRLLTGERLTLVTRVDSRGSEVTEVRLAQAHHGLNRTLRLSEMTDGLISDSAFVYSLVSLPYATTPLLLVSLIEQIKAPVHIVSTFVGLDRYRVKSRIESSRKRSARGTASVSDVDSDVTFEEATEVAQQLSSGTENMVAGSLLIVSDQALHLDPELFIEEKRRFFKVLAVLSALGLRKRLHRSFVMRLATASDLIPNIGDPYCVETKAMLKTPRGRPLYLDFQDPGFSALHMNVNGASGVGKSVFVMALLRRMVDAGVPLSVLFVDHLRSFRRFVHARQGLYLEPETRQELTARVKDLLQSLNKVGVFNGVEMSELGQGEKKEALKLLLTEIEKFLKARPTHHPIYVVMDECWSVLKDEPVLVQRAFREFRKLDGAAVAVTQSLTDLLTHENGQAIFQNSPIQVVLRQREDPAKYTGDLGLNQTEIERVRYLKQEKGVYSECLIKTPFFSRIGRIELTPEEHELYRTDTIRREVVQQRLREAACRT